METIDGAPVLDPAALDPDRIAHGDCPECTADAAARDDAAEAERAATQPRCGIGGCEEEAGASGYCGQHDRGERPTCATDGCTAKAERASLFCGEHMQVVGKRRKKAASAEAG